MPVKDSVIHLTVELVRPKLDEAGDEALKMALLPYKFSNDEYKMITEPVRRGFQDSFDRQGTPTEKWWPLAEETQAEREALDIPGIQPHKPILIRTHSYEQTWVAVWDPDHLFEVQRYMQLSGTLLTAVHIKIGSKDKRARSLSLGIHDEPDKYLPERPVHIISDQRLTELGQEIGRLIEIKIRGTI